MTSSGGLVWELVRTSAALALVCAAAYLILRFGFRKFQPPNTGSLRLLAKLPLEPRRSVYLIETAGRAFLVGCAETGVTLIAEVSPAASDTSRPATAAPQSTP